jgi:DNA modification methylase
MINNILEGDCLEVLKTLPDNSVDSVVTDPPYELGFMGKSWDNTGIANNKDMWGECLRVLKPGGHLLAFSGTRTYHRMAVAIEDAGFEVRDMIEWVYASGFPKSLNIGKAVDRLQGNEREVVGQSRNGSNPLTGGLSGTETTKIQDVTKGTSEWEGWGTALKPAHEPICMARKPLAESTVAQNVLKWGTGGVNIDISRVESGGEHKRPEQPTNNERGIYGKQTSFQPTNAEGRFPANLIHDNSEEVRECFPDAKGFSGGGTKGAGYRTEYVNGDSKHKELPAQTFNDSGNASRFFKSIIYQAKASKSERNKGCEGLETKTAMELTGRKEGSKGLSGSEEHGNSTNPYANGGSVLPRANYHPTVKPIALMEYLIKMVTPQGGIVLDPFAGSGSTLVAAKQNNFKYVGIELTPEYIPIIKARLDSVVRENKLL